MTIAAVRDVSQQRQLRRFGAAALRASEDERKRIAQELHDDTAQRLSALLLRLRLLERDHDLGGLLEGFRSELSQSVEAVRRIARGLRPPEIEDAGIAAALRAHARQMRESNGFEVEIRSDPWMTRSLRTSGSSSTAWFRRRCRTPPAIQERARRWSSCAASTATS